MRIAFALALALLYGPSSARTVYSWTDAQGLLHYSDQPPQLEAAVVPLPPANVLAATPMPAPPKPRTRPASRPQSGHAAASERRAKRAEQCHQAEQKLREVRAKRRMGYSASEGRKLKQRARRHQADLRFYCE